MGTGVEFSGKEVGHVGIYHSGVLPIHLRSPHVDLCPHHLNDMHPFKTIWSLTPYGNTRVSMNP
jgi:hypothetical protein